VDANVFVASFLSDDRFHDGGTAYVRGMESGEYIFHVPTLVPVEVIAAIWRRSQKQGMALVARATQSLAEWETAGKIVLYPLDRERMAMATDSAVRYRLSGSDSVIAALSGELNIPLKTFDAEIAARFAGDSV